LPNIGFWELLVILVVALLIFGPKAIPKIGKAIGSGLSEFKKASRGISDELTEGDGNVKEKNKEE